MKYPLQQILLDQMGYEPPTIDHLGGGFKHVLCSPLFGETIQFGEMG